MLITMKAALGEKINKKAYAGEKTAPKEITLKLTGGESRIEVNLRD